SHRMHFGKDRFVKRLRERLPEYQRAEVVELSAGEEAVAQVRAPVQQHRESSLLDARSVRLLQAAILHAEHDRVEIRASTRFPAELHIVSQAAGCKFLHALRGVEA